ncbi:hypothetical protein BV25DRAFT_1922826 [Artomyces pyxidatus]|uniref:Uncharacterized protein n=1 Tax=Artomyces pyxidatus TaxID=48021 RepID=A0ACB8SEJ8_9AGAM|nr:hypothetical protein BV25DRAFT_1922826 [Artomyces pyxidatus]
MRGMFLLYHPSEATHLEADKLSFEIPGAPADIGLHFVFIIHFFLTAVSQRYRQRSSTSAGHPSTYVAAHVPLICLIPLPLPLFPTPPVKARGWLAYEHPSYKVNTSSLKVRLRTGFDAIVLLQCDGELLVLKAPVSKTGVVRVNAQDTFACS